MIGFNNKCLEYVSVSAYQIVRSLTILFNIILAYFVRKESTSSRVILACAGVIVGFFLGVEGEIGMSWKGAIYGVASSFFVALYAIKVKQGIELMDNNEYLLIEYNTPISIIILTPFVWYSGEFDFLKNSPPLKFWGMQTLAGVVGFIINIAIYLNISYTTPLTHNLAGTLKACLQTLLAFFIFPQSENMTPLKLIGTGFVIGFSGYYAYVRKCEMDARKKALIEEQQKKAEGGI